ncbi:MAG: ABC transporter permease [Sarcina sp.]
MGRLVKAEILKLSKNKNFLVGCIACVFIASFIGILASEYIRYEIIKPEIVSSIGGNDIVREKGIFTGKFMSLAGENPVEPTMREIFHSSFSVGMLEVLIAILIVGSLTREYREGVLKNILAYGVNRRKFYLAKFIGIFGGTSIFISILAITGIIESSIFIGGFGEKLNSTYIMSMIFTMIATIIVAGSVVAILMLLSIFIKSSAGIIGISVGCFIFLPNFINSLYGKVNWFDNFFKLTPIYNMAAATSIYSTQGDRLLASIIGVVTAGIFLFVGSKIFEKQDIN